MPSKAYLISEEDFKKIIKESFSYAECCRKIGYSDRGHYGPDQIKKDVKN